MRLKSKNGNFYNLGHTCKTKFFEKFFFMDTAIGYFSLINSYRVFSLKTTLLNVSQLRQENFPTYPKSIFRRIFSR